MSSEVCPYCGKTYKRLKSHLPHCKAAPSAKTPAAKHEVTANQATSSPQDGATLGGKSTQTLSNTPRPQSKKGKKTSVVSSEPETPIKRENASSSAQTLTLNPAPTPPMKKKKLKLSEQIRTANISPPLPSPSPSPSIPSTKKQSLRTLIEAEKSKSVTKGTTSISEDQPVGLPSFKATLKTKTKADPDNTDPSFFVPDTKPKDSTKVKASKKKKAAQSLPTIDDTSDSARPDQFKEEVEDLSVNSMFSKSGSGHQGRITLQDVKATLGRGGGGGGSNGATRKSRRPSILSQIEGTEGLGSKTRPGSRLSLDPGQENIDANYVASKTVSNQLPSTSLQNTDLQILQSKPVSLIPLKHDGPPASSIISVHQSPQAGRFGISERKLTASPSINTLSSPHLLPIMQQPLPARSEVSRTGGGVTVEVRTQNTAGSGTKGNLMQQSLGQVTLRKLPEWLACKTPTHPRDVAKMVQRGWQWYYKRYIDVRKGGVGGVGMLVAGYCVLSYIWSFPHLKHDRWRKYH